MGQWPKDLEPGAELAPVVVLVTPSESQRDGRIEGLGRTTLLPEGIQPLSEGLLGWARWERREQRCFCPSISACIDAVGFFRWTADLSRRVRRVKPLLPHTL